MTGLRRFRLRTLRRHTASAAVRSMLFLPFLTAVALGAARRGISPQIVVIPLAFVVFATLWLLKVPWRLEHCAQLADLGHDGRSPVVSAWELCRSDAAGTFDSYICACGCHAVPDLPPRNAASPLPWKIAGGLFLVALAFLLIPDGFSGGERGVRNKTADVNMVDASATIPAGREATHLRSAAKNASGSAAKKGKSATHPTARGSDAATTASGDGSADAVAAKTASVGTPWKAECGAVSETQKKAQSGVASDVGVAEPGEDADQDHDAAAPAGESRRAGDRRSRKRADAKRRAEAPQDRYQLTAFDHHPPAGRDASTKEEHGDKPGDGRGGETGAKKARGTGTALPAIPLPDSVAGRLGSGSDAITPGRSRGEADTVPGAMSGKNPGARAPEPPIGHPGFTSRLRKTLPVAFSEHIESTEDKR